MGSSTARPAPTLLIRADATPAIGVGHVMRCLALAQAWIDRGGKAAMVCSALPDAIAQRLDQENVSLLRIQAQAGSAEDAVQTAAIAQDWRTDWLLTDGYAFTSSYHKVLRGHRWRLAVMDDKGHLDSYVADLVLNQNLHADAVRYEGRCLPETRLLLGPSYALLRREFRLWDGAARVFPPQAEKMLVLLGGSDPGDATTLALESLSGLGLDLTVVVGPANPRLDRIRDRFGARARILANVRDLTPLIREADIALSSAGSAVWEMARFATPMILGAIVDVEELLAARLERAEGCLYLGPFQGMSGQALADAAIRLANAPNLRHHLGTNAQALIDGQGADRVTAAMLDISLAHGPESRPGAADRSGKEHR